ncbi:MAG TPA: MBL fold metallo-hydrolase [Solirubrobacteraceae bacterium]|jgi:glyoxylase-like metal-dependent hydrolase (beta-lactamase superfamily II)/predicted ester cyclase|nr:MBL fold metallo-hydrolase [Solirubrobacteraceae bacterium]
MAEQESDGASKAASKVQEAAANVRQARSGGRRRIAKTGTEAIARRYFEAIDARDLDTAVGLWADGGRDNVRGQVDVLAPEGVRAFLGELLQAVPDLSFEVVSTTTQDERCAVQWRLNGTFAGPGQLNGIEPTGDRVVIEGVDLLTVRDELIQANDAYPDSIALPRQIGMMPAQGSGAEGRLAGAFNAKTRLGSRLSGGEAKLIAEGVWVVQGQPARCNVYLIEDEGGVMLFDAGARTMTRALARAGAKLGGIRRIVLGHGHTDHRGGAPGLGAPVYCHPAEVLDAEGSGGFRYWPEGLAGIPFPHRQVQRLMHRYAWDGGPVEIAGTVSEGDQLAGFSVVEIPGHAPGQIALWRESDRLALSSDCFYTLDIWGRDSEPHIPFPTYNFDTEQARASMRKLAELQPAAAWPGHAKPLTGDVRSQLLRAAEADA